jgi:hypothetical protein
VETLTAFGGSFLRVSDNPSYSFFHLPSEADSREHVPAVDLPVGVVG